LEMRRNAPVYEEGKGESVMAIAAAVSDATVQELRSRMRGTLLQPEDYGYDAARTIWNAMIDRRPALIARCASAADVILALRFAREHGIDFSVRGGGHNVSGNCIVDDGLMIDLSAMKSIRVTPDTCTAQVEPGVVWGDLDREAQAFDLATVGGTVATTGVAGLTLGGGFGWLTNKHGLTIDNLLSADVVTADGRLVHASDDENPDLFWALRGAGANFGIVTSFQFRLHPVGPEILGGMVLHPVERAGEVLRFYREFIFETPDELTTYAAILTNPEGHQVIALAVCYVGDLDEGEKAVAPLRAFGNPVADLIAPMTYLDQQAIITAAMPYGRQNYWKSGLTRTLTDEAIDTIADYMPRVPSPYTAFVLAGNPGVAGRVPTDATAYHHRDARYNAMILASWDDAGDSEENLGWIREFFGNLQSHLSGGVYVNDLTADESEQRVRDAYGGNYDRLARIKAKYDPGNIFHHNQNIEPAK
jgi:FAD/FMN-containing dehydrogenase